MASLKSLHIKESVDELKSLLKSTKNPKYKTRIKVLIALKSGKYKSQKELSKQLNVHYITLNRWVLEYKSEGIESFIQRKPDNANNPDGRVIPKKVKDALIEIFTTDKKQSFKSYVELLAWINKTFDLKIKYPTLRMHIIRKFGEKAMKS